MRLLISLLTIIVFCLTVACQEMDLPQEETSTTLPLKVKAFTGLDIDGQERTCVDKEGLICSEVFTDSDQYALDCQRQGHFAIQCGCHDWICVDEKEVLEQSGPKEEVGLNIDGEVESCVPFDYEVDGEEVACTMEFTVEDQFAIDCQEAGHKAIQCGCHKYICVE